MRIKSSIDPSYFDMKLRLFCTIKFLKLSRAISNVLALFVFYFTSPLVVREIQQPPLAVATQASQAQAASFGRAAPIAATLERRAHSDEASEEGWRAAIVTRA